VGSTRIGFKPFSVRAKIVAISEKIGMLCKKYNLKLVEDNAQAHGCLLNGKRTGAIGDAAV